MKQWHSCYDEGWKDIIVPEAFSHPAKMAYGLLKRILAHARDEKWIRPRDIVVDPFGGIGSTGIIGAYADLRVICVELERKFVDLARKNFVIHNNIWQKLGCPYPVIFQGDSRQLCQIVEKADCIVSSPPFTGQSQGVPSRSIFGSGGPIKRAEQKAAGYSEALEGYGQTPGQLGAMKPGKVDMVVSSPPYAEIAMTGGKKGPEKYKTGLTQGKRCFNEYGKTSGNLGNLKSGDVDLVLSSPPYEGSIQTDGDGIDWSKIKEGGTNKTLARAAVGTGYGKTNGQLAEEKGDTFWSAAKLIIEQCFQILKPGGHAIWVVKSFVRKGKIVDFPGDWRRLCESVGFKTVCVHHAMLVKETTHTTLFGHTEVKRKERKSFFRRLAEAKGSPRIDFEVVLCMSK